MAYTEQQQARLDAAQKRLDNATAAWKISEGVWNQFHVGDPCYSGTKYDATQAATWFTPNNSSCTSKGECNANGKDKCKLNVQALLNNLPMLRKNYAELLAAQANYKTVTDQVNQEVKNDPDFILEQQEQKDSASYVKIALFFGGATVLVIALVWAYKKFIR